MPGFRYDCSKSSFTMISYPIKQENLMLCNDNNHQQCDTILLCMLVFHQLLRSHSCCYLNCTCDAIIIWPIWYSLFFVQQSPLFLSIIFFCMCFVMRPAVFVLIAFGFIIISSARGLNAGGACPFFL